MIKKKFRLTDQLRALQQQHGHLLELQRGLQQQRRTLLLRQALLSAWCDSMTFVQLSMALQEPEAAVQEEAPQFSVLLEQEVQLLNKLNSSTTGNLLNGCGHSAADGIPQAHSQLLDQLLVAEKTISPATSPMTYLHRFVSQPAPADPYTMTAEQVASLVRDTTQTVSIKLHLLEGLAPGETDSMVEQIAAVWDR